MGLKDILFGKEVQISDTKLGVLKARIKKTHPSINYVWASEVLLSEQQNETVIVLEGNSEGPFKKQLESAYSIVDNLTNIQEQIIVESKKNKNKIKYNGDWIKQFYLAAITPIDVRDNSFEVNFEPINQDGNGYILLTWKNSKISELDIK